MHNDGGMPIQIGQRADHGFDQPLGLLSDCHRRIERFLHVLLVTVEQAQGGALTPPQRADVERALQYFAKAAPLHTADEEESLFPRLRACSGPAASQALAVVARLESDHGVAEQRHHAVHALMARWLEAGQLAAADTQAVREHLQALQAIYREHIAVEDGQLFPAAARLLGAGDLREIGGEMAARRGVVRNTLD